MAPSFNHGILLVSFLVLFGSASGSFAQDSQDASARECWGKWQVSLNIGTQMSGIKDEDFVASNIAPLLNVTVGKWFSPSLALQFGYKGWYYHQIIDDNKYGYGLYYGEAVLNVNSLFRKYSGASGWSLHFHGGAGYFYNYHYDRPNVCANLGISNNYRLGNSFMASLDVSAVMGWDIYQGNADILPGLTVGFAYLF